MRIALIQMNCGASKKENIENAIDKISTAADKGAQVICLPELFHSPYTAWHLDKDFFDVAETINGELMASMKAVAKSKKIVLLVPFAELVMEGICYNSTAVVNPEGEVLGLYRKNHIPHSIVFQEKYYFTPGDLGYPSFQTELGTFGVLICYDRYFPEAFRVLCLAGATVIFIPICSLGDSAEIFTQTLIGQALVNQVYIAAVNRVGKESQHGFFGNSAIVNPMGEVIAGASSDEEILIQDIDYEVLKECRRRRFFYRDRRPETYGALCK